MIILEKLFSLHALNNPKVNNALNNPKVNNVETYYVMILFLNMINIYRDGEGG